LPKPTTTNFSALPEWEQMLMFKQFAYQNNKTYSSDEFSQKFIIFKNNLAKIDSLNAVQGRSTQFGVTKFADLSPVEFKKTYLGTRVPSPIPNLPMAPEVSDSVIKDIPTNFDWRTKGAVTPVKNQGQCGSCWAFSTTGNVEGMHFLSGKPLVGLSEQNLVDCDHECMIYEGESSCDAGCDGGLMPNAFHYIVANGGIDSESSYPYEGVDDTCSFKKSEVAATITNYTMVSHNESQMAAYMYQHGPLSIAADAEEWQFYIGGVFSGPCGTSLDHGILIVGYGKETDYLGFEIDYWWVKNSWGADWGISGYLMIQRGVGECGLNLFPCSSIIQ